MHAVCHCANLDITLERASRQVDIKALPALQGVTETPCPDHGV